MLCCLAVSLRPVWSFEHALMFSETLCQLLLFALVFIFRASVSRSEVGAFRMMCVQ